MPDSELLSKVESAFSGKIVESHTQHDNATIVLERADLVEILTSLRDDPEFAFNMLVDLSAVDFFGQEPRFEVVYHLYSLRLNHRLRRKDKEVRYGNRSCEEHATELRRRSRVGGQSESLHKDGQQRPNAFSGGGAEVRRCLL
jgi:hypothetical protein